MTNTFTCTNEAIWWAYELDRPRPGREGWQIHRGDHPSSEIVILAEGSADNDLLDFVYFNWYVHDFLFTATDAGDVNLPGEGESKTMGIVDAVYDVEKVGEGTWKFSRCIAPRKNGIGRGDNIVILQGEPCSGSQYVHGFSPPFWVKGWERFSTYITDAPLEKAIPLLLRSRNADGVIALPSNLGETIEHRNPEASQNEPRTFAKHRPEHVALECEAFIRHSGKTRSHNYLGVPTEQAVQDLYRAFAEFVDNRVFLPGAVRPTNDTRAFPPLLF